MKFLADLFPRKKIFYRSTGIDALGKSLELREVSIFNSVERRESFLSYGPKEIVPDVLWADVRRNNCLIPVRTNGRHSPETCKGHVLIRTNCLQAFLKPARKGARKGIMAWWIWWQAFTGCTRISELLAATPIDWRFLATGLEPRLPIF